MNRNETLKAALDAVTDRGATYGKPEAVFEDVAILWSDYISKAITAFDVTQMMILLKVARAKSNPHHADNQTDIAGYAACANELMHKAESPIKQPDIKADDTTTIPTIEDQGMSDELRKDIAALARVLHTYMGNPKDWSKHIKHSEANKRLYKLAESYQEPPNPYCRMTNASVRTNQKDVKVGDPVAAELGFVEKILAIKKRGKIIHKTKIGGVPKSLYEYWERHHRFIDEEPPEAPTIPTPQDFLAANRIQTHDTFYFNNTDDVRQCLGHHDSLYLTSIELANVSKITRNGQVVAARHFWEDR